VTSIRLAMNYADPLGANDTAHALAKDGKLSTTDLTFIAANFGNKDGKTLSTEKLVQAGFCHKDAVAIATANDGHHFRSLDVSFGSVAQAKVTTNYAAAGPNDTAHARARDGQLASADLRFIAENFGNKDGKTLSVLKLTQASFSQPDAKAIFARYRANRDLRDIPLDGPKAPVAPPGPAAPKAGSVHATAHPEPAHKGFFESVVDASAELGKGFVEGVVDNVVEIGQSAKDFAVNHPYITGAVVVGAAALVTVASGGIGGPAAAGVASGILTGLSYTGVAAGTVIATYKTGQGIGELADGHFEAAGKKFGGAGVEVALTFGPGQVVKRLKTATRVAEFQAKELQAFGKLGDEANQIFREMNATSQSFNQVLKTAPKIASRGLTKLESVPEIATGKVWTGAHQTFEKMERLEALEKLSHDVHNYTGIGELTTAKGSHAVHIVTGSAHEAHEAPGTKAHPKDHHK
jgi:hypothetical protein